jgi:S-formylglutathione hydrolase FrmB
MGGYGAVINSMRTNMETFKYTCAFNGALYVSNEEQWNLSKYYLISVIFNYC